jgi:hypothetical protein
MSMSVDMSARGITTRLKRVSQLRRLCLLLGKAKATNQAITDKKKEKKVKPKKDRDSM